MVISVKGTYTVKPAEETPIEFMYVSHIDNIKPITHAPKILLFRKPHSDLPISPFETTKRSLSKVLSTFYPLAGRLQWASPSKERLQLNCNAVGAQLVEAECDSEIDDFGDFCPTAAVAELLPPLDYKSVPIEEQPLLLVQFTKFSCGGICLGLRLSHVIADGTASIYFISVWSRVALGEDPQDHLPFLDRTLLKPPPEDEKRSFDKSEIKNTPLIIGHTDDRDERRKETTPVMLKISKEQIDMLKDMANKNNITNDNVVVPFTRFEVLSAHMWRCACKARRHRNEQPTVLRVVVNIRKRIEPNLPEGYFGNAALPVVVTTTAGELLAEPLSYTCCKIRDAVDKVNNEFVKSCLGYLKDEKDLSDFRYWHIVGSEKGPFFGNPNISVTSLLNWPLRGTDFGWGKDIHMAPALLGYDGKSFLLPSRDGDGSIVVALRLRVDHMDAYKKFFYGDILGNKINSTNTIADDLLIISKL